MVVWGKLVRLHIPTTPNALTVTAMPAPTTPTISQAFCTVWRSAPRRPNAPFRSDMAATSANCCQDGPNCGPTAPPWLQLRHSLAPTCRNLILSRAHLKATQVELHMGSIRGTLPAQPKSSKHAFILVFSTKFWLSMTLRLKQRSSWCASLGARLAVKLSKGPKLHHSGRDLEFVCIT